MSFAQALSSYLNINALIAIGFLGLAVISYFAKKFHFNFGAAAELKLHYALIMTIFGLSIAHPLLPGNQFFSPPAKVWSAPSLESFGPGSTISEKSGYLSLQTPVGTSTMQADSVAKTWMVLALTLFIFGCLLIARDFWMLLRIKRHSFLIRQVGQVRILVSDRICIPFSFWLPGQATIVIPTSLIHRREECQMVIAHELQHHRQGDTRWVYVMQGLKLFCIINPFIYFWNRWISEIQEFACDETLVDQNKVDSQAYARCLVEVAQTAINQKNVPVCATGLTLLVERNILKRRVEKMLSKSKNRMGGSISIVVGLFLTLVMGVTAFAAKGLVHDRRVSLSQAQAMAVRVQSQTGFPVVVNDLVVKQLNRYIGTPEGREFVRDALARMESYEVVVGEHLKRYGVPAEIMALPIIESGYQNLTQGQSNTSAKSAGLWQFIPSTAKNYGLEVNSQKDERLDVALETDAAMRYLQSNNLRFKDWHLAALAYNMGERAVQNGMDELGSKDAWTLIRNGYEGDKDYLPKLMAAIIIMRNPDSVR